VTRWLKVAPQPEAWRPDANLTPAQRAVEQDGAAGGHTRRRLVLADGRTVTASIALRRLPSSRRIYAYLRWSAGSGRTHERYVGDVTEASREANLRQAWGQVHELGLLTSAPKPG